MGSRTSRALRATSSAATPWTAALSRRAATRCNSLCRTVPRRPASRSTSKKNVTTSFGNTVTADVFTWYIQVLGVKEVFHTYTTQAANATVATLHRWQVDIEDKTYNIDFHEQNNIAPADVPAFSKQFAVPAICQGNILNCNDDDGVVAGKAGPYVPWVNRWRR